MSYILDALRKSEQERRNQDSVASLSAGVMGAPTTAENKISPWVWIAVAVVLSVNILGLLIIFKDELTGKEVPTVMSDTLAVMSNTPMAVSNVSAAQESRGSESTERIASASSAPVSEGRVEATSPSEASFSGRSDIDSTTYLPKKYQLPSQSSVSAARKTDEYDLGFDYSESDVIRPRTRTGSNIPKDHITNESFDAVQVSKGRINSLQQDESSLAERYQAIETAKREPKYDVINASSGVSNTDEQVNVRKQLLDGLQSPEVIKPSGSTVSKRSGSGLTQRDADALPRILDLPAHQQSKVPPIHFSGHLYSSRPESRSIRLDGTKYKEGDRVSHFVSVYTITEDGVVFDLEGNLFYISSFEDWDGIR